MAMPPFHEFGGWEFAPGTVRGVRSFRLTPDGRLTGVSFTVPWTPGENEAHCMTSFTLVPSFPQIGHHRMAECRCGFYGYYDGSDDYGPVRNHYGDLNMVRVSAVVEGYGFTVIGTRGFRTAKARIVALCLPEGKKQQWVTRHEVLAHVWLPFLWMAAFSIIPPIITATTHTPWGLLVSMGGILLGGLYIMKPRRRRPRSSAELPPEWCKAIRAQYPGVPTFSSFEEMVRAFPPDTSIQPTIEPIYEEGDGRLR